METTCPSWLRHSLSYHRESSEHITVTMRDWWQPAPFYCSYLYSHLHRNVRVQSPDQSTASEDVLCGDVSIGVQNKLQQLRLDGLTQLFNSDAHITVLVCLKAAEAQSKLRSHKHCITTILPNWFLIFTSTTPAEYGDLTRQNVCQYVAGHHRACDERKGVPCLKPELNKRSTSSLYLPLKLQRHTLEFRNVFEPEQQCIVCRPLCVLQITVAKVAS